MKTLDKWHLIPYPLAAFIQQTTLDPLTTNGMAQYKISFEIIVEDIQNNRPAISFITPAEQTALTTLKDIAQLHAKRPINIIIDKPSTLLFLYVQRSFTTTNNTTKTTSSSSLGYSSSSSPHPN
jgi:hypothetical protein